MRTINIICVIIFALLFIIHVIKLTKDEDKESAYYAMMGWVCALAWSLMYLIDTYYS
jgi:L-cystine uptake protein TcyP (sodium:dicarboxylate symporter family)